MEKESTYLSVGSEMCVTHW